MKQHEYLDFHAEFCEKMNKIAESKSHDYSGVDNIFNNFTAADPEWTEIGFYTRMMDKMSRIKSFIKSGDLQVKDESVADTLMDLANYSILLAAYLSKDK